MVIYDLLSGCGVLNFVVVLAINLGGTYCCLFKDWLCMGCGD